jgi:ubiquinone/menaquinone biosynthesis C-methylase UbiE
MSSRPEGYIPAAGEDWLLPLYDPLQRFVFREKHLRRGILEHAQIGPRSRILDVGCGTGTQALVIKRAHPDAEVIGLDGDPKALARARTKLSRAGVDVALDEGLATALPYPNARFDRVVSSLVFHHLSDDVKRGALAEIRRVLAPGGFFLLADFGRPVSWFERLIAPRLLQFEQARTNISGGLRDLLARAGFAVEETPLYSMGFARVWCWRATA